METRERRKRVSDNRQFAPAAERNRDPILSVLKDLLEGSETVLEIASGTGEHAVHFASAFPDVTWQPTNFDDEHFTSAEAWREHAGLANIKPTLRLDACANPWPVEAPDYEHRDISAIFNANMIHISPWEVTLGLFNGASRILSPGNLMILYGPYKVDGEHTADSNKKFEDWLKGLNPGFGIRDIGEVSEVAKKEGLHHRQSIAMPANNFIQVFQKS
nr:DUF938 domain-containing protein [Sneathiella limimaris]